MARGKHAGMPSVQAINDYWEARDLPMAATRQEDGDCFACGRPSTTMWGIDRAHIDPGGGEGPENLHLLCKACHVRSEYVTGDAYWRWFAYQVAISDFERLVMYGPSSVPWAEFTPEERRLAVDGFVEFAQKAIHKVGEGLLASEGAYTK